MVKEAKKSLKAWKEGDYNTFYNYLYSLTIDELLSALRAMELKVPADNAIKQLIIRDAKIKEQLKNLSSGKSEVA